MNKTYPIFNLIKSNLYKKSLQEATVLDNLVIVKCNSLLKNQKEIKN